MTGRSHVPAAWTLLVAVVVASAVLGRACYLGRPFDSDAAMFAYMGRLVAGGGRVGPDLVDNKFPTVGLVTSAAWRACGTSWGAWVLLGAGLSAVAAGAVAGAARRAGGAAGPAGLFAVVFLNLAPAVNGGFQLETPIACLSAVAALCAVRAIDGRSVPSAVAAGLAAGCGVLLKPTAGGVVVAMGVGVVVRAMSGRSATALVPTPPSRRLRSAEDPDRPPSDPGLRRTSDAGLAGSGSGFAVALAAAAGFAVPLAVAGVYLSATHLWAEVVTAAGRLRAYAGGSVVDVVSWVKGATVAVLLGFPFVVGRGGKRGGSGGPTPAVRAFAVAWLLVEAAGVVAQRRMYAYHFLPLACPAALLFGLVPRRAGPVRLLGALGPAAVLGAWCALRVIATPTDDRLAVGRYLSARAAAGDLVWADDWPRLVIETGLRPASRQALTFLFANDDAAAAVDSAQLVADLDRRRPAFVVLPADLPRWLDRQTSGIVELAQRPARAAAYRAGWRRIERYTLAHYRREATVGGDAVYRRVADPAGVADVGR